MKSEILSFAFSKQSIQNGNRLSVFYSRIKRIEVGQQCTPQQLFVASGQLNVFHGARRTIPHDPGRCSPNTLQLHYTANSLLQLSYYYVAYTILKINLFSSFHQCNGRHVRLNLPG